MPKGIYNRGKKKTGKKRGRPPAKKLGRPPGKKTAPRKAASAQRGSAPKKIRAARQPRTPSISPTDQIIAKIDHYTPHFLNLLADAVEILSEHSPAWRNNRSPRLWGQRSHNPQAAEGSARSGAQVHQPAAERSTGADA